MEPEINEVIIIGAGMSGIGCATKLLENGIQSLILEARDRIGGRLITENLGSEKIDLGASFIHGSSINNPIYQLANKFGMKIATQTEGETIIYSKNGDKIEKINDKKDLNNLKKIYRKTIENAAIIKDQILSQANQIKQKEDFTIGDAISYVIESDPEIKKLLESEIFRNYWNYLEWSDEEYEGCEYKEESLLLWEKEALFEGGDSKLENGYFPLIKELAKGLKIKTSCEVISIENYDKDLTSVLTNQGVFYAKKIVLTVPIGVLKNNQISFIPQLPDYKRECISRIKMGLLNKIVLLFDNRFWEEDLYFIEHFSEIKGEFPWIENFSKKEPILFFWLGGEFAEQLEKFEDSEIIEQILKLLKLIYGKKVGNIIDYKITRWRQDQYSRGSYSNFPKGCHKNDHNSLGKTVDNLYFCGEATCPDYLGTVHGAYMSGTRVAKEILEKWKIKLL